LRTDLGRRLTCAREELVLWGKKKKTTGRLGAYEKKLLSIEQLLRKKGSGTYAEKPNHEVKSPRPEGNRPTTRKGEKELKGQKSEGTEVLPTCERVGRVFGVASLFGKAEGEVKGGR